MAAYNASKYINAAIDSIISQSHTDFELIIIEDGSQDDTLEVIQSYKDSRIRLIQNERNVGLIKSLNKGLDAAAGEYIARMDADDISLPHRLELQSKFLDAHPEVGFCGTWVEAFGEASSQIVKMPIEDGDIRCHLAFENAFIHSSIMMRRAAIEAHNLRYDHNALHAEDYDLWVRFGNLAQMANIPSVSVRYRNHVESISHRFQKTQKETADKVRCQQISNLKLNLDQIEPDILNMLLRFDYNRGLAKLDSAGIQLSRLADALIALNPSNPSALKRKLSMRWYNASAKSASEGIRTFLTSRRNPLFKAMPAKYKAILLARCLMKKEIEN